jgi:putative phage-type endonuclease
MSEVEQRVYGSFQKPQSFHDRRSKGIGGSEIAAILGISPYRTAYHLWQEKTKRMIPEDISSKPHVMRGILGEETCRAIYERQHLKSFRPKTWQGLKPWHLCSDDGYNVDDNSIMEIKCMGQLPHAKAGDATLPMKERIPEYYYCQIQWNLFVSKAAYCLFISFRPEDESMHVIRVDAEPEQQAEIEKAVDYFWLTNVQQDVPPPLTDKDYVPVADRKLDELLEKYEALKVQKALVEGEIEAVKESVRGFIQGHPAIRTLAGHRVSVTSRSGGVDYARFIKDRGIPPEELKAYQKKPVEVFTIRTPSSKET